MKILLHQPLTPALSPPRGDGERQAAAGQERGFSPDAGCRSPSPLRGERAGVRDSFNCMETAGRRARAAFTLADVLAALAFMAIVIPVAVEGLRVANLAGQVGERKAVAARVAERVLNELVVAGQWQGTSQNGTVQEGVQQYRWLMRAEPWSVDAMRLVTVQVFFSVQGQDHDVRLSTLVDTSTQ